MNSVNLKLRRLLTVMGISLIVTACGHDDDRRSVDIPSPPPPPPPPVNVSYEVTVTNLTNAQPLSPVAVILHAEGNLWQVGQAASQALEQMAEGGDASALRGLDVVMAEASGQAPIGPGGSESISVTIEDTTDALLSVATMLVNTNDAFSGLNAWDLSQLEVGESWTTTANVYDAGTEANGEGAGTIPGPADGGTGYDAARDDVDFVALHPGVVSGADGNTNSVLTAVHKFDNPAVRIRVMRTE